MAKSHGHGVEVQQIYLDIHFGHVSGKVPKQKGIAKVHAKGLKPWRGESAEGHVSPSENRVFLVSISGLHLTLVVRVVCTLCFYR